MSPASLIDDAACRKSLAPACCPRAGGDQNPTDSGDHDLRCADTDRPLRPADVAHQVIAESGDHVVIVGRVAVGLIGIPSSELGEVLGVEKLPQPRRVIRGQTIMGNGVDGEDRHTSTTCPASTRQCRSVFTVASIRRSWVTRSRVPS